MSMKELWYKNRAQNYCIKSLKGLEIFDRITEQMLGHAFAVDYPRFLEESRQRYDDLDGNQHVCVALGMTQASFWVAFGKLGRLVQGMEVKVEINDDVWDFVADKAAEYQDWSMVYPVKFLERTMSQFAFVRQKYEATAEQEQSHQRIENFLRSVLHDRPTPGNFFIFVHSFSRFKKKYARRA